MQQADFLRDILILLAAAVVMVFLVQRLRISAVLGYLAAGVMIGPHATGLISDVKAIHSLAELGVVFLLFSIGLELSFKRLAAMQTEVFGLGTAQVGITGSIVGVGVWLLGASPAAAVVIGCGVALSSTAIVLQLMAERGELSSRVGRTAFSILLLQDMAIVPMLALLPLLGGGTGGETDLGALAIAGAKAAGVVVALILVGRFLLSPLLRAIAALDTKEIFVAIVLLCVLGTGWATEQVGLSLTLGAFLAGLMVADTEFRHQVETDIRPFQGLLMGLFFIVIGMELNLAFGVEHWWQVLSLVAALIAVKAIVIFMLCRFLIGIHTGAAFNVALLLAQGGEFALVLISVAVRDDLVPTSVSQMVLSVVSVSMALTPFLAIAGRALARRMERQASIGLAAMETEYEDLRDHVIIAGFGRFGQTIAKILDTHKIPYIAFDMNPDRVQAGRAGNQSIHFGDATRLELLWGAGIDRAKAIVFTVDEAPTSVTGLVGMIRRKLPDLRIIVRARDEEHATDLDKAGATAAVPDALASSLHLARAVMRGSTYRIRI
jgi:CPA2 family monovalent cation:H+ antiporter-2